MKAPDGTEMALSVYPGEKNAPLVLILHGLVSHQGWYRELAHQLAAQGVNTCMVDRRGCGKSAGLRGHVESWQTLVDDVVYVLRQLKLRHPGCSTGLVGISLGGVTSLAAGILHPDLVDRQVLSCPGLASSLKVPVWRRLRLLRRSFMNPTKAYDVPFGVEMLTDRSEWHAILNADPLRTKHVSARFLVEFFRMQRFVALNIKKLKSPVFCMLGGDDAIIDNERVERILGKANRAGVTIETFEGAQHVLHSSVPPEQLVSRVSNWFLGTSRASLGQTLHTETSTLFLPDDPLPDPPSLS
jgi:alpha-beta hydrolase superfamily lysophospholipase